MKRRQTVVCGILAAVLAVAFSACPGPNQMEPGTGSVAGTVVFPEGEGGIAITLTLEAAGGQFSLEYVVTDEAGGSVPFRFDDVPPGNHVLYASWRSTPESEAMRGLVRNVEVRAGIVYPLGNITINLGCGCGTIPDACGCAAGNVSCACNHGNVPGCSCDLDDLGCGCTHGNVPGCDCDPDDLGCTCTAGAGNCACTPGAGNCTCTHGNVPGCTCDTDDLGCGCGTIPDGCACDADDLGCGCGTIPDGCGCGTIPDGCACDADDLGCGCGTIPDACGCGTIPDSCACEQPVAAIRIVSNGDGVTALGLAPGQYRVLYAECPGGNALSNVLWFSTNPDVVSVQRPAGRSMLESGETVQITVSAGADIGDTATIRATSMGGVGGNLVEAALLVTVTETVTNFVRVEGGTFQMGSCPISPVTPIRDVTVSGFYMSRFQVTQGELYDVMGTRPSLFTGETDWSGNPVTGINWRNLPVEQVSWYDALVFSNRLSIARGLTPAYSIGGSTNPDDWGPVPTSWNTTWNAVTIVAGSTGYRLPTEAQWEFAARGGIVCNGNYTFSGSNTADEVAWYGYWDGGNSGGRTHEVGTRQPNALGLYDMSGNVWEWVWDWFGTYPDYPETDPTGASSGFNRVLRGGSWADLGWFARSAFRLYVDPSSRYIDVGFRLVRP